MQAHAAQNNQATALETALTKSEPRPRRKHGNIPL